MLGKDIQNPLSLDLSIVEAIEGLAERALKLVRQIKKVQKLACCAAASI